MRQPGHPPHEHARAISPRRVPGLARLGTGSRGQEQWAFTLLLDRWIRSAEEVDWPALLPSDDVTRWLTVDPQHKQLVIEPTAAVSDAALRH